MILDAQNMLSNGQSIGGPGDIPSTDIYDTGSAADVGIGYDIYMHVRTRQAFTTGGGATLQIVLQDSADNSSWADVQTLTPARAAISLPANTELVRARMPIGMRRFIRFVYRVANSNMNTGTLDAHFALDVQSQQSGASGFTVA